MPQSSHIFFALAGALVLVAAAGGVYFGYQTNSDQYNTASLTSPKNIQANLPTRLNIPGINVNAAIEHLGLTPEGAMDAPEGPDTVAWFDLGPRPGEKGSAVIAGHYGRWKNSKTSVFDNLGKLKKGDKVYVEDADGKITAFVVKEARRYKADEIVPDVFNKTDGKYLNLITCSGTWLESQKTYSDRLVIFTEAI